MDKESNFILTTNLKKIKPGQKIVFTYIAANKNTYGTLAQGILNDEEGNPLPEIDPKNPGDTPSGWFYFNCVGYNHDGTRKLIADRVIQTGVSWEILNTEGLCVTSGKKYTQEKNTSTGEITDNRISRIDNCYVRLIATTSAENTYTDKNHWGEWDEDISYNEIDNSNEAWHFGEAEPYSWTLVTPQSNMANRVIRGKQYNDIIKAIGYNIPITKPQTLLNGYISQSDEIDFSTYKSVEGVDV